MTNYYFCRNADRVYPKSYSVEITKRHETRSLIGLDSAPLSLGIAPSESVGIPKKHIILWLNCIENSAYPQTTSSLFANYSLHRHRVLFLPFKGTLWRELSKEPFSHRKSHQSLFEQGQSMLFK